MRRTLRAIGSLLATPPAFAAMQARSVAWLVGTDHFSRCIVYDDATREKHPGLVMVPNWMGANGAADASVTQAQIVAFERQMDAARADWQFVNFGGAVHSFTRPESKGPGKRACNARAAKRALVMMRNFFDARVAAR